MKINQSSRTKLGILLIVLFAITSSVNLLRKTIDFDLISFGKDSITLYDKRFCEIRKELPGCGTLGYITDINPESYSSYVGEYYLTQYALSPLVVDNAIEYPVVIGNFHSDVPDPKNLFSRGLSLVKNYSQGVLLLNNKKLK
jgi:hypothetical protein